MSNVLSTHNLRSKNLYYYANLIISCELLLPELKSMDSIKSGAADISVSLLNDRPSEPLISDWIHHWPSEIANMSLAATDVTDTYMLRFSGLADFVIAMDPQEIGVWAAPETSMETLRHLLLDQVLPRVLAQQGRVVLHAGAVNIGGEAIAFVGETGSGKSTLTASFNAANCPLLTDDSLILTTAENGVLSIPSYSCLRLWPAAISKLYAQAPDVVPMAHYSLKQRVIVDNGGIASKMPFRLSSIYLLAQEPTEAVSTISHSRLPPAEACLQIIRNSFQLDVTDRVRGAAMLEEASKIAEAVPFFAICYPRKYSLISDVVNYILENQTLLDNDPLYKAI